MNLKELYQKSYILPVVIAFTYTTLLLDTIKYPGFFGNHFIIDAKIFLVVSVMCLVFLKTKDKVSEIINKLNLFVLALSGFGYLYFSIQEAVHYTNYVLSRFHISLGGLIYIFLSSASLFVAGHYKNIIYLNSKGKNLWKGIIYFFVIYTLVVNLGVTLKNSFVGDIYVALHLKDTYDQKMRMQWGTYYNYMVFVKQNTPEDATIIVPPQILPWVRTGNVALDRYFLYPRKLIQYSTEQIPDVASLTKGTYILVSWGDWECDFGKCKLWPQQKIEAREKIIMDPDNSAVRKVINNVIYSPQDTNDPYGLLRI